MTDEIELIRARILEAADIAPPMGRQRKDSKAAKVRALMPELLAYRKRYPYATDRDMLKLLQDAGMDVKLDTVRKVLRTQKRTPHAVRAGISKAVPSAMTPPSKRTLEPGSPALKPAQTSSAATRSASKI